MDAESARKLAKKWRIDADCICPTDCAEELEALAAVPVPTANQDRLREALVSDAGFLRRYLEQLVHVPMKDERGHIVNGFAAAQIPDWAIRQRLEEIDAALAAVPEVAEGPAGFERWWLAYSTGLENEFDCFTLPQVATVVGIAKAAWRAAQRADAPVQAAGGNDLRSMREAQEAESNPDLLLLPTGKL